MGLRTLIVALSVFALHCAAAFAQGSPAAGGVPFPSKAVRLVVPFAPGGQTDIIARLMSDRLASRWGQPVVVENKPGAATTLGADFVAKSPADGHTILMVPAPFVITQYAYARLPYDGRRDFVPVTLLITNPGVLVVNPSRLPVRSVDEFIAAVRKEPGKFQYGSTGNGGLVHLGIELLRLQTGIDVVHVPYKGSGPAVIDLVGGQIAFMTASPAEVMPYVSAGKLRIVATTAARRIASLPDIPTFAESGYKDYEVRAWFGVVAPSATPAAALRRLNADIVAVLTEPEVRQKLEAMGSEVVGSSAEDFGRFLEAEHGRWSSAVKAANVKIE